MAQNGNGNGHGSNTGPGQPVTLLGKLARHVGLVPDRTTELMTIESPFGKKLFPM